MDDLSAEVEDEKNVDVICRLLSYVVKPFVCGNDDAAKDDQN